MVLVALGGYLVSRFFGPRRADADSDAQGQHAITRSLFAAVNSGQTHDIETWVAEGFAAYVNGYTMAKDGVDRGPELLAAVVDYHRESVGEPFWELYDEVVQKVDRTTSTIAIRSSLEADSDLQNARSRWPASSAPSTTSSPRSGSLPT